MICLDPLDMPPSTTEEHEEDQAIWEEGEETLAMEEGEEDQFEEESLVNRCVKVLGEHYNLVDWPGIVIPDHLMRQIRHARTSC